MYALIYIYNCWTHCYDIYLFFFFGLQRLGRDIFTVSYTYIVQFISLAECIYVYFSFVRDTLYLSCRSGRSCSKCITFIANYLHKLAEY